MKGVLVLLFSWTASVSMSICSARQREAYAVEGEAVVLHCYTGDVEENLTISWTKNNHTIASSPRVKFKGSSLWFLSTVSSDSGHYVCSSNETSLVESIVSLSVEKGPCPKALKSVPVMEGDNVSLTCTDDPLEPPGEILQVQWWKDCKSTEMQGSEISLYVSLGSTGYYTCKLIFRYEGKNYMTSYTLQLNVQKNESVENPEIIRPRNNILYVKPGVKTKLECTVFIGSGEEALEDTIVYWTINDSFIDEYPQLQQNFTFQRMEDNRMYGTSTLFITEVITTFFEFPFKCIVLSSRGTDTGLVWLSQVDPSAIQTPLIIASVIIILTLVGVLLFLLFKIDIILSYRHLCGKDKSATQGSKIYNAYVCYCHDNSPDSSRAEDLTLRIIPEVLEQQHGLKLFIHGRDDASTEGNVAGMTDAVSQSRMVLLVLPGSLPGNHNEEESNIPLSPGQDKLSASHCRDLFSVIAQSSVPVIVVECGENADYSLLPESIQSIIQRTGVLRWNPAVKPSGHFWKHLRYHMT